MSRDEIFRCINKELELLAINADDSTQPDLSNILTEVKVALIEAILLHTRGNQKQASKMLGINRATLRKIYDQRIENKSFL